MMYELVSTHPYLARKTLAICDIFATLDFQPGTRGFRAGNSPVHIVFSSTSC
jgi:hypothetical protein